MNQQKTDTTMSLQEAFEQASTESKQLPQRPSDEDMLKIYALFKQATVGPNKTSKPSRSGIMLCIRSSSVLFYYF